MYCLFYRQVFTSIFLVNWWNKWINKQIDRYSMVIYNNPKYFLAMRRAKYFNLLDISVKYQKCLVCGSLFYMLSNSFLNSPLFNVVVPSPAMFIFTLSLNLFSDDNIHICSYILKYFESSSSAHHTNAIWIQKILKSSKIFRWTFLYVDTEICVDQYEDVFLYSKCKIVFGLSSLDRSLWFPWSVMCLLR